ncbi:hypothetical protein TNIN_47761 [Trichonephila inaurata madagascariensis]|uniref:Uncharacterized protein n=1 Tax=Trichonephila inaurata madagascariensis TaxID=2747483 RepID=A0A8X6YER0_9ARAC|nr:hypothetical protein TNIN_47761 [Trichonephila inaurata madagascariensis]
MFPKGICVKMRFGLEGGSHNYFEFPNENRQKSPVPSSFEREVVLKRDLSQDSCDILSSRPKEEEDISFGSESFLPEKGN